MTRVRLAQGAALLAMYACSAGVPGGRQVGKPEAMLPATYTQISNVVELSDGRIAFAAPKEKLFLFADLKSGKVDTIGTPSDSIAPGDSAPGRYKFPGYVFRLGGDTVALADFATERTTLWNEQGKYLGAIPRQDVAGTNQPVAFDTLGNAYKEDYRSVMGGLQPGQHVQLESLSVVRLHRGAAQADTVAELKLPDFAQGRFGQDQKAVATIFSGRDLFGVLPSGWLWVARSRENRVDWRSPDGTWHVGTPRPWQKVRVTQADKDRFMEMAYQNGLQRGVDVQFPFATEKPPFTAGASQLDTAVWLLRSRASTDSTPVYDVVHRDGTVEHPVVLPNGATLGGFGKDGAVYLILHQGDSGVTVGRFRLSEK